MRIASKRKYPVIDMVKTGKNIKRIMCVKGFTVKDIQRFLALEIPQSIYHWFDGKSMPTLDNIYALSELFHIPVDDMLIGNRKYSFLPGSDPQCRRLYSYYERLSGMVA